MWMERQRDTRQGLVVEGYSKVMVSTILKLYLLQKMNIARIILSLEANYGLGLQQFDVKNTFQHWDLDEVYMMSHLVMETRLLKTL